MLSVYVPHGVSLERIEVGEGNPVPESAIWFDLVTPTLTEDKLLERHLGIAVPTREEMQEIEVTRLARNCSDWYPLLDSGGFLKKTLLTRPHLFDSDLDECGPPALITDRGVMLIYNGKNANGKEADPSLPQGTYSVGRVFFDLKDMQTILVRSDDPFLKPTLPHEISGQYAAGTTFAEGLVFYKKKWYLYYGTADSFVGVAISK
jgi:predicted GH43/DUF377 family glycosyl hydrolase